MITHQAPHLTALLGVPDLTGRADRLAAKLNVFDRQVVPIEEMIDAAATNTRSVNKNDLDAIAT